MDRRSATICTMFACAAAWFCAGCETLDYNHWLRDLTERRAPEDQLERHREKFVLNRDPNSFRWLAMHALENGMTVMEINHLIGDTGERLDHDQELKSERGEYHQTDVAYKWGPDAEGRSIVLFFREGRLVHYNSRQFAAMELPDRL